MEFPLAPMSTLIRAVTAAVLLLPVALLGVGFATRAGPLRIPVAIAVILIYVGIWVWGRPTGFHASETGLQLRFPWRRILVARAAMRSARRMTGAEVRAELGLAIRVGAGGLWGAFGWLWSRRRGWLEIYVSRQDDLVWIERADAIPLLLTPSNPQQLIDALAIEGSPKGREPHLTD